MKELMELVKLPFEILSAAGENAVGYGFLMVLFGSAVVTVAYYVLDLVRKVVGLLLDFVARLFESLASIFKRKPEPCRFSAPYKHEEISAIIATLDEINKKLAQKNSIF